MSNLGVTGRKEDHLISGPVSRTSSRDHMHREFTSLGVNEVPVQNKLLTEARDERDSQLDDRLIRRHRLEYIYGICVTSHDSNFFQSTFSSNRIFSYRVSEFRHRTRTACSYTIHRNHTRGIWHPISEPHQQYPTRSSFSACSTKMC